MAAHVRNLQRSPVNNILTKLTRSFLRQLVVREEWSRNVTCSRCFCSQNATPSRFGGVKRGLDKPEKRKILRKIKTEVYSKNSSNLEMEKAARIRKLLIPLDEVRKGWRSKHYSDQVSSMAAYYEIYNHMFNGDMFYPSVVMDINYGGAQVHYGNFIEPEKASCEPDVQFSKSSDSFTTLFMVNLDGNILSRDCEVLHWMVGNIPNGNVQEGEVISGYIPPFPVKGTGFHRFVFCLANQNTKCNFEDIYRQHSHRSLANKSFKTTEFLGLFQDNLQPIGLSFFQATWDETVSNTFTEILGAKEPIYDLELFLTPNQKKRIEVYDVFKNKYTNM